MSDNGDSFFPTIQFSIPDLGRVWTIVGVYCLSSGMAGPSAGIPLVLYLSMPKGELMKLEKIMVTLCEKRGWTLARLARESGVPKQTLHNWTSGRRMVNPVQLKRVAVALQVSVHFLMFGEGDPFESPGEEILKELFSGDVRVTVHRIERKK